MQVGILCEHSDPARGGAERYLDALERRLRERGHQVTVCARTGPHARKVKSFPAALRPWYYARAFLPELRKADVILSTVPVPGCGFYQPHTGILGASVPAHLDPLPAGLRHLRRYNPQRVAHFAVLRAFEARAVAPPARVLALSPRVVEDLRRFHPGAQAILRRPGVDLERFRPGAAKKRQPRLLFVATNFRLKGLPALLRAMKLLPRATLTVVGRDKPIPADRVTYVPHTDDLPALYRDADVLVHPTWYDTASLVVLEALASGTPAITTVRDGNADLAEIGGGEVLEKPGDASALARSIERVYATASPELARAVAEKFPERRMLDEVVDTLCASSS
ncbi:MAG: glycosyltransferase family 4 protein [Planctomycetota bacterium]